MKDGAAQNRQLMTSAWHGTVRQALDLAPDALLGALQSGFLDSYGRPSQSEVDAWRQSLPGLLKILGAVDLPNAGIAFEFRLPVGEERADVLLLGGSDKRPVLYVLELKQWESIQQDPETGQVLVPGWGRHQNPLHQVANYLGKIRLFHGEAPKWNVVAGVWAPNLNREAAGIVRNTADAKMYGIELFARNEDHLFREAIRRVLTPVSISPQHFQDFHAGHYTQTRHLFDVIVEHAEEIAKNATEALAEAGIGLTEEQELLSTEILSAVSRNQPAVFVVQGGPGSGKTLLAIHLLLRAIRSGKRVTLAIRNNRLQAILRSCFNQAYPGAAGTLVYFETQQGRGIGNPQFNAQFDLLICDEAQRMRRPSMEVALARAPVSAIFLDETQRLNPPEEGTVEAFRSAAASLGQSPNQRTLRAAVRCRGGQAYNDWIEALLSDPSAGSLSKPTSQWGGRYRFSVMKSAEALIAELALLRDTRRRVALVASFTESPGSIGSTGHPDNLRIGYPLKSGWDKYRGSNLHINWLMRPDEYVQYWMRGLGNRLETVASIYGAQGFEGDYVGVVWGRDLLIRNGQWTLGDPTVCYDTIDGLVSRHSQRRWTPDALTLVKNRYRIFLTRGILGTLVYFEDDETAQWAESSL